MNDYNITNGDGTIYYSGMTRGSAYDFARQLANEHRETFFVASSDYEGESDEDLGDPVEPGDTDGF